MLLFDKLYTKSNTFRTVLAITFLLMLASTLPGQVSSTGQIVGSVQDGTGAAIPGAELKLENAETKISQTVTSAADGGFIFTSLQPGTYTLSATLRGFDKGVYSGIVVNAARTTNQLVSLKIGSVTETVEVSGAAPVLQTTSTTISNTVDQKALQDLPLPGRSTLNFALLIPGAQQGVTARDSTFEGMPGGAVNITLNGITNNSQRFKSGGTSFFAFVTPRLETVQEVTISTSNLSADNSTGQGSMQIQYVSKQGTNAFHGEAFWQHSNSALNANAWFNNANRIRKPVYIQNDQGGSLGGPILKNRLFFFLSYAQVITPSSGSYSATVLNPAAQNGNFSYVGTDGVSRTVNLLAAAGRSGFTSSVNPIIGAQLQKIQASTSAGALSFSDLNRNTLTWVAPQPTVSYYPMGRFDWLITQNLRFNVSDTWNRAVNQTGFRGTTLPGSFQQDQSYGQIQNAYIGTAGLTWTIKPNLINDFAIGTQSNQETFNTGWQLSTFYPRLMTFPLNLASGLEELNGLQQSNVYQPRNNPVWNLFDNLKLQQGNHSFSFGGNYIRSYMHSASYGAAGLPRYTYTFNSADPASALFSAANFPAISNNNLADAQNLYALLTGRVNQITITRNLNSDTHTYADLQPVFTNELQTSFGLYFADSWRINRNLTMNYGLRWDFQGDDQNPNGVYTSPTMADLFGPSGSLGAAPNLFAPGSLQGIGNPAIYQRSQVYNKDYINPGPTIGLAWNPSFQDGWLNQIFGDKKSVFRAGYSLSYYQEGMNSFTSLAGNNPGPTQTATLASGSTFAAGSLAVGDPLPPSTAFPASFSFPLALSNFAFAGRTVSTINPDIKAPYVQTWSASWQRELKEGTVVEVRYAGNRGVNLWHAYNVNEVNIFENGFLSQFQTAQRNLALNQAAGRGATFANNGLPGQAATPIFATAFNGLAASQGFANTTFIGLLQSGQAGGMANQMAQNATYFCNMVGTSYSPCAGRVTGAGAYPINFFQLNPYVQTANLQTSNSFSSYNGLQIEVRHRYWHGLTFSGNYTWSHSFTDRFVKSDTNILNYTTLRNRGLDKGPSPWDLRHVVQVYGTYDIPFGRGRMYSVNNPVVDAIAGGWTIGSIFRFQTGLPFRVTSGQLTVNQQDSGVIANANGAVLQSTIGTYKTGNPYVYFINPSTIGSDGRANPNYLALPTAAGQFGTNLFLHGPHYITDDLSVTKSLPIFRERLRTEIRAELVNAFNHPIFQVPSGDTFTVSGINISSTTFGRSTATITTARQVQFRLRFVF